MARPRTSDQCRFVLVLDLASESEDENEDENEEDERSGACSVAPRRFGKALI